VKSLLVVLFVCFSACAVPPPAPAPKASNSDGAIRPAICQCSDEVNDPITGGCFDNDSDADCVCLHEDNCPGVPNCDRTNTDGDAFGDLCDEHPNTPDPEATIASLDTRIDALEAAQSTITALQADVVLLVTALAEVRAKYPEHFHGLLGLNGDPVGTSGDLGYTLPGD
jgi:hypothetical protein